MKRKSYITPEVKIVSCDGMMMLCVSGVSSSFSGGIGYGGIDEDGSVDAGVRGYVWDEDGPFEGEIFGE